MNPFVSADRPPLGLRRLRHRWAPLVFAFAVMASSGCGGGSSSAGASAGAAGASASAGSSGTAGSSGSAGSGSGQGASSASSATPATRAEASRLLAQATFGPTSADIDRLVKTGNGPWLDEQLAMARTASYCNLQSGIYQKIGQARSDGVVVSGEVDHLSSAFYTAAVRHPDQVRQRMVWAWSQIFVTSIATGPLSMSPAATYCRYLDLLGEHALGNFRTLLDHVARSWHMGVYLTHASNAREEKFFSGQIPDQNFAREVMQLFTIGLKQLNPDGTLKLDAQGQPIPTYTQADIIGLSRVFTGWECVRGNDGECKALMEPVSESDMHSCSEKKFLGTTLDAGRVGPKHGDGTACNNPAGKARENLKAALDTLFNHPNVGPFIGKQLIQRLVTSNPSAAYVARVSAVFGDNGNGVRGDLKAVVRAILLDPEARSTDRLSDTRWGKVREPFLRTMHLHRVFAPGVDGVVWTMSDRTNCDATHGYNYRLGQHIFRSPTVFNFYRPGFRPPGGAAERQDMVAPEMQILNTQELAFWSNHLSNFFVAIDGTWKGQDGRTTVYAGSDFCHRMNPVQYTSEWLALGRDAATTAGAERLVDRLALEFMAGQLGTGLRARVVDAVVKTSGMTTFAKEPAEKKRIQVATTLLLMSPGFLVQK